MLPFTFVNEHYIKHETTQIFELKLLPNEAGDVRMHTHFLSN